MMICKYFLWFQNIDYNLSKSFSIIQFYFDTFDHIPQRIPSFYPSHKIEIENKKTHSKPEAGQTKMLED